MIAEAFLVSTGVVALGEMGDKTQIATVMLAALLTRKAQTSAISSGAPSRFIGVRLMMRARASSLPSTALCASSVAMVPGATAFTRMPCSASASAITRVNWFTPPLLAL